MNTFNGTYKIKVIIVTDGDRIARKAVERAAENLGLRVISKSAGNPTHLSAGKIIELIKNAQYDPVVVMVDDKGFTGTGKGERVINKLSKSKELEILGVIAVASNTEGVNGIKVDCSVTKYGNVTKRTVDKDGNIVERKSKKQRTFFGCDQYPVCEFISWDKPISRQCPKCSEMLVEKKKKKGINVQCSKCDYEEEAN